MTAKYWGRGPEKWTAPLISARTMPDHQALPSTTMSPNFRSSPLSNAHEVETPSPLCRRTIHYQSNLKYETIPDPEPQSSTQDISDESTWQRWTSDKPLAQVMQESLADNSFTEIAQGSLPFSTEIVVQAAEKTEEQLEAESWAFAIMAGNLESISDSLENGIIPENIDRINPFHLAASYLNGGKSCCWVLSELVGFLGSEYSISTNYIDSQGHTVLDKLMLLILRSHTSIRPQDVSVTFLGQDRWEGQEKDMCGRWDADSPCVRQLYKSGAIRIPHEWKHTFCHTSVQAICHSISAVFGVSWSPDINRTSGLFQTQCAHCRAYLRLLPLHSLVVTACYLANDGTEGETLFGTLACLVCMLTHNADPTLAADISLPAIFGHPETGGCGHEPIDATSLASKVPESLIDSWPPEARLGWRAFTSVLQFATKDRKENGNRRDTYHDESDGESDDENDDGSREWARYCPCMDGHFVKPPNFFCGDESLGTLWASIQTEFLSYRRQSVGDPWLSTRFSMRAVCQQFEHGDGLEEMPLISQALMNSHTRCGWFDQAGDLVFPNSQDVCSGYYMNLEDWGRTTFIEEVRLEKNRFNY